MLTWVLGLGLGCTPQLHPAPESDPDAPPSETVILVLGCTFRADRLHVYGNPRETSPYLDSLAAGGARFERMISNAPWTRPGMAALTTGIHPLVLEIDDTGDDVELERGLSPDVLTLGERFSGAGFATIGATANPNLNERFGFAQGFDRYLDTEAFWREGITKWPGEDVVDAFLEQAAQVDGALFGQLALVDPHRPLGWLPLRQARLGIYSWKGGSLIEQYDSELVRLDDALQRLEQGLAELGRSDRLMVVVGDHGEGLFSPKHAGRAHARWLYDANLHVPLIFNGPGVLPGHVIEGVTQSVDLAPTLLGLVGIEGDELLQGRSQLDAIRGERDRTQGDEILSATHYGPVNKARLTTPYWTYIRNYEADHELKRGEHELYNPSDLDQSNDVSEAHPEVVRALSLRLQAETELLREDAMRWELEITDENREQLEALGYVD